MHAAHDPVWLDEDQHFWATRCANSTCLASLLPRTWRSGQRRYRALRRLSVHARVSEFLRHQTRVGAAIRVDGNNPSAIQDEIDERWPTGYGLVVKGHTGRLKKRQMFMDDGGWGRSQSRQSRPNPTMWHCRTAPATSVPPGVPPGVLSSAEEVMVQPSGQCRQSARQECAKRVRPMPRSLTVPVSPLRDHTLIVHGVHSR